MKTQQELIQTYWGQGGTVDMVKEYNAKHGCDVKPWECVKCEGAFKKHPEFTARSEAYTFALTILYDDKRKEHRPVFVGDLLYPTYPMEQHKVIELSTRHYGELLLQGKTGAEYNRPFTELSWNPPTPKRTFKLNDMELPCPDVDKDKGENAYFLIIGKLLYRFNELHNRTIVEDAINNLLTAARDKE